MLRFRYLTQEEVTELLDLTETSPVHPILCIAAFTGARKSEILHLEWKDVDLKKKKVFLRSRKGSRARSQTVRDVDLHPKLVKVLKKHKKTHPKGRYVFSNMQQPTNGNGKFTSADNGKTRNVNDWLLGVSDDNGNDTGSVNERTGNGNAIGDRPIHKDKARRWLERAVAGTDYEHIGFHTLRHSFASNLAAAGVDDRIIDHFMGHQTVEMRRRYQHLFPSSKRESILALKI